MDQVPLVGGIEGARDLGDEAGSTSRLERAAIDQVAQVRPLHPAHRDVEDSVLLARLVHRDDVRVIDRGGDHPFAPEPLAKRGVSGQRRGHQLQRHRAREPQLGRAVDDAHPAAGGHLFDPVAGELRADLQLCCCLLPPHTVPQRLLKRYMPSSTMLPFGTERPQRTFLVAEDPQPERRSPRAWSRRGRYSPRPRPRCPCRAPAGAGRRRSDRRSR